MKYIFKISYLIIFCNLLTFADAQTCDYKIFNNISLGVSTAVNCFVQDSEGMIWIGSDKGLYSYDGYTIYSHYEQGSISNTRIYCGIRVGNSRLYLGSDNGLLIFNYRTERYESVLSDLPRDIRCMVRTGNNIWVGSINGLYLYNISTKKVIRFPVGKGLPNNTIYSIIKASDGNIYIGTYNGFCYYDTRRKIFRQIALVNSTHKNNVFINSLFEDRYRKCIWIGTEGELYSYNLAKREVFHINRYHGNSIKTLVVDKEKNLLIGTDDGLHVFDGVRDKYIRHNSRDNFSLSGDIVWNLYTDSEKNVWIGTDNGLSFISNSERERFIPIFDITGKSNGNQFYVIYRDWKARVWLGGPNGLIQSNIKLINNASTKWYRVGNSAFLLKHNHIRNLYQDRDKTLWLATDGGIMRLDEKSGQWKHYNLIDKTHTYNANWAYDIAEDSRGRLWVATCLGGVLIVDKSKLERSTSYCEADYSITKTNGLAGMYVRQIVFDKNKNMWMSLYNNGIQKINVGTMQVSTVIDKKRSGMVGSTYLLVDREGYIWIAYRGGVLKYSSNGHVVRHLRFDKTLEGEVLSMTEVKNEIWISTTNGIWMANKYSGKLQQRGNDNIDFTCVYYSLADNLIYMGYKDGVAITSPENYDRKLSGHKLQLTAVYINNSLIFAQKNKSIRYIPILQFKNKENHIVFCFSDLPYLLSNKNKFAFKLEGEDKDWNVLSPNTNQITFNNLKHGKYRLRIKCLTEKESDIEELEILFEVLPPWYLTWWSKVFYALIVIAFLYWAFNFLRIRNRLNIERIEKKQMMEQAKLKMDFFANISHEFKTPLSMIIAPVSKLIIDTKNELLKKQLQTIERNAMKLNSMVQHILDFDRIESHSNSVLMLSKIDYISFARKIFNQFQMENFEEKAQTGAFITNCEVYYCEIDILKMESALTNILSNASKYTPRKGHIEMEVSLNDNQLETIIRDNGIGIPSKDMPYVSQRFFQSSKTIRERHSTGIGLYLSKAYIELHGGTFRIESEEGKGTNVTLAFPVEHYNVSIANAVQGNNELPVVLLVEDDKEMLDFMVDVLSSSFLCERSNNGKEGLEKAKSLLPDLIITDAMMPEMDGFEMCKQIRKYIPTSIIPIIMLTGKSDRETEIISIQLGIDAFLSKPFDANVLLMRSVQLVKKNSQKAMKERVEALTNPKEITIASADEKFLQNITLIIEDRINDYDLNVNALCEQYGISSKQLYRKIKNLTGLTPVEYIKSIRMKKAAMLLKQNKFTIAEVMYMVGFSNSSYFSKCFQAAFGKTPRQYIENKQN